MTIENTFGLAEKADEIVDPLDGRIVDPTNADSLIDSFEAAKEFADRLWDWQKQLRQLIAALTEGDAKTRRVRGEKRRAKVTMPSDAWDQSILKEAWNAYPKFRDEFLTIATLRVRMRELKKMNEETGPDDFESFRAIVQNANLGPQGLPSVSIEQ